MLKEMGKIAGADSCAAKKVRISIGVHINNLAPS
jgi:hypothetical protein